MKATKSTQQEVADYWKPKNAVQSGDWRSQLPRVLEDPKIETPTHPELLASGACFNFCFFWFDRKIEFLYLSQTHFKPGILQPQTLAVELQARATTPYGTSGYVCLYLGPEGGKKHISILLGGAVLCPVAN